MKCRKPKLNIKQYKLIVKKHKIDIILSDVYLECMILKCKRGVQNCCSTKEIVRRARKERTIFSTINNFIRYKYWCLDKPKPYICIVYRRSMYYILLLSPIILLQLQEKGNIQITVYLIVNFGVPCSLYQSNLISLMSMNFKNWKLESNWKYQICLYSQRSYGKVNFYIFYLHTYWIYIWSWYQYMRHNINCC